MRLLLRLRVAWLQSGCCIYETCTDNLLQFWQNGKYWFSEAAKWVNLKCTVHARRMKIFYVSWQKKYVRVSYYKVIGVMKHIPNCLCFHCILVWKMRRKIVCTTLSALECLIMQTAWTTFFARVSLTIRLPRCCLCFDLSVWLDVPGRRLWVFASTQA